jgi:hypothetical protein
MLFLPLGVSRPRTGTRGVTTTDALKFVGVTAFLIDHYGLCLDPDQAWWRLVGRIVAPIFFFLIGFARTRSVPWTWLVFGAVLTATEGWVKPDPDRLLRADLDILFSFAILRFAVLPLVDRILERQRPSLFLVVGCVILVGVCFWFVEYSIYAWPWALLGLSHRLVLEDPSRARLWIRLGLALTAGVVYVVMESIVPWSRPMAFSTTQIVLLSGMIAGLTVVLLAFRRTVLRVQPPALLAPVFRFCGRYSLEIYAITLFGMWLLAWAIGIDHGAGSGGDGDSDSDANDDSDSDADDD